MCLLHTSDYLSHHQCKSVSSKNVFVSSLKQQEAALAGREYRSLLTSSFSTIVKLNSKMTVKNIVGHENILLMTEKYSAEDKLHLKKVQKN